MIHNNFVSVIVVTYNSSQFVVEALESISKQTWSEIEIIITDDCSGDDTVELCQHWLNLNSKRFVYSEIITTKKNTGIPANANRGLKAAKGVWIKLLAGDDTLKLNCIKNNMVWIASHPEVKVLFSGVEIYKDSFESKNLLKSIHDVPYYPKGIMASNRGAESQYKMLLIRDRIYYTPSAFINKETLLSVGGYDERFKILEDYPLWLNLTKNGYRLFFMDKATVNYRQHSKAIFNSGIDSLINFNYFKREDFRKVYTYPYLPSDIRLNQRFKWYVVQVFRVNWLNKNKKLNRILFYLLTFYLNPFNYYIFIKKHLNKKLKNDEFYMD